jgi:hypothetical protein
MNKYDVTILFSYLCLLYFKLSLSRCIVIFNVRVCNVLANLKKVVFDWRGHRYNLQPSIPYLFFCVQDDYGRCGSQGQI